MTPSATKTRGGRIGRTRDDIITALRRYAELYGDDFTAAAFSPSTAKWRDDAASIERYYAGDPDGIGAWPSLNSVKEHFGGSFNAAREAAGLAANKPGPSKRRKRAAGSVAPVRGVSHVGATRTVYVEKTDEETLARLRRDVARATARAERAEAKLAVRPKPVRAVSKPKVDRVLDEEMLARVRRRAEQATAREEVKRLEAERALAESKSKEKEARGAAIRAASKLERAEATINGLREERRELKAAVTLAEDGGVAAKRELVAAREDVARLRAERRVVVKDAPEQAVVDEAIAEADAARSVAHRAEMRAAKAEREYMELASAVKGEPRRLSRAEVLELKASGPSGPAVLGEALKALAKVKASGGNPAQMQAALSKVASTAIGWKEAL